MNRVNQYIKCQMITGYLLGHYINNEIILYYNNNPLTLNIPLISTVLFPIATIFSPIAIVSYYLNSTVLDNLIEKYEIKYYKQYSDTGILYSSSIITIKRKIV